VPITVTPEHWRPTTASTTAETVARPRLVRRGRASAYYKFAVKALLHAFHDCELTLDWPVQHEIEPVLHWLLVVPATAKRAKGRRAKMRANIFDDRR